MRFEDLRLSEPLLRAVRAEGYLTPTPIQVKAIPQVLAGRDILGCAQTGTGKTAAFALPMLERLGQRAAAAPVQTRIRALVLCPTRELAGQIEESFCAYGKHARIRTAAIFGGVSQAAQVRALRAGAEVVIATPGRLLDLMGQGYVNLGGVEMLVLDEADRMLDMGFLPDIRRVLGKLPRRRQSMLFSATMPAPIRALAAEILNQPVSVEVARVSSPAETVTHWVHHVEPTEKPALLIRLLDQLPKSRVLVFTRTKRGADKLTRRLVDAGVRAAALHGNKSQGARTRTLEEFRSAQTPVMVATDLAARGLDVDQVAQVINFDLTPDPETYVHRIGRTGRAGASGVAVSFCSAEELEHLTAIERLLRSPLKQAADPHLDASARTRTSAGRAPRPPARPTGHGWNSPKRTRRSPPRRVHSTHGTSKERV